MADLMQTAASEILENAEMTAIAALSAIVQEDAIWKRFYKVTCEKATAVHGPGHAVEDEQRMRDGMRTDLAILKIANADRIDNYRDSVAADIEATLKAQGRVEEFDIDNPFGKGGTL